MVWHLIAAICIALCAAGIMQYVRILSRKRLPKWTLPVAAGLSILCYQVYFEYTWAARMQAQLPANSVVISTQANSMLWRPWTYAFPLTNVFTVIDKANIQTSFSGASQLSTFIVYRFEQGYADQVIPATYVLNCTTRELLALQADNQPDLTAVQKISLTSSLYQQVC